MLSLSASAFKRFTLFVLLSHAVCTAARDSENSSSTMWESDSSGSASDSSNESVEGQRNSFFSWFWRQILPAEEDSSSSDSNVEKDDFSSSGDSDSTSSDSAPPIRTGPRKVALIVNCSYQGTKSALSHNHVAQNAKHMKAFAEDQGFHTICVDDFEDKTQVGNENIKQTIRAIYSGYPEVFLFYYYGHGVDCAKIGMKGVTSIGHSTDPVPSFLLQKWLITNKPKGTNFIGMFNCCHAGRMMGLGYNVQAMQTSEDLPRRIPSALCLYACSQEQVTCGVAFTQEITKKGFRSYKWLDKPLVDSIPKINQAVRKRVGNALRRKGEKMHNKGVQHLGVWADSLFDPNLTLQEVLNGRVSE